MTKPVAMQYLSALPSIKEGKPAPSDTEIKTHVDQRLKPAVLVESPRQMGKTLFQEVGNLLNAGDDILRSIQNGALFSMEEASIAEGVRACDALEKSISKLREMGF